MSRALVCFSESMKVLPVNSQGSEQIKHDCASLSVPIRISKPTIVGSTPTSAPIPQEPRVSGFPAPPQYP